MPFSDMKLQLPCSKTGARLFTFYWQKYFFPMADDQTFSVFVSKVQNEQGILLFS